MLVVSKKSSHILKCLTNGFTELLGVRVRTGTLAVYAEVDYEFVMICTQKERERERERE